MINKSDDILLSKLEHLKNHNCYLPHIGENFHTAETKIFVIAESHYLPKIYDNKISVDDWYNKTENFENNFKINKYEGIGWINTRNVVKEYLKSNDSKGGLSLFYNLEKAYSTVFASSRLFNDCIFFNYFQRPSEISGDSIKISKIDSKIALENLLVQIEVFKPNKIIFVSSKSYNDFLKNCSRQLLESLPFITSVPHASASSWWNRKSAKFGLNNALATGKEKFIRIITPKY